MNVDRLEWDSNFFSLNVGKVDFSNEGYNLLDCGDIERFDLLYLYNPGNLSDVNNFISIKFPKALLCDVNIQFKMENNFKHITKTKSDNIQVIKRDESLFEITEDMYIFSRFYSDPRIDNKKANKLYISWLENSFDMENKEIIGYYKANKLVGFLLYRIENNELVIELIRVENEYRNMGIAHQLIEYVIYENFINKSLSNIIVGTQINNIPAMNLYSSCGFKVSTITSIYHWWKEE